MATKSNKKTSSYREGISKSDTEIQAEQLDLNVQQAENTMEQGLLSVKSQMITKESEVKKAEVKVKAAEQALEASKYSVPLNPQTILDRKTAVEQAKLDLLTANEAFQYAKDSYEYLSTVKAELFS